MNIIIEFAGGPLDGKTTEGHTSDQGEAARYYALTHHGRVGQHFSLASEYAIDVLSNEALQVDRPHHFQRHTYRVAERLEGDGEVLIRAVYVPPGDRGTQGGQ